MYGEGISTAHICCTQRESPINLWLECSLRKRFYLSYLLSIYKRK